MKYFLQILLLALSLVALKAGDYPVKTPSTSWTISQSSAAADSQLFVNEDTPVSDYSVYGWTTVASENELTQHAWIFFFRLTINQEGSVGNVGNGDRTLAAWWSSDNRLHFTGYTTGNPNRYDYLEAIPVQDLVDGPFFTYLGYSSAEQSVFAYIKLSNGNVYSKKVGGYAQSPTNYLGFYVGVDYNNIATYPALDGVYQDWYVSGGPDSWVGSDADMEGFIANVGQSTEQEPTPSVDIPVQTSGLKYQVTQTTDASETSLQVNTDEPQNDYSVYGWYQVANTNLLTQRSWIFFFRLTINEEGNLNDLSIAGDRTLAAWWSSDNRLHFTGYTNGNNNYYDYLEAIPVQDLVEGPFFTYYGYSSAEQSVFIYLRTSNGNVYSNLKAGYAQNPTSYLGFYLGVDFNNTATYANLDGNFWNWFVSAGPESWVGSEEDMDSFIAGIDAPEPVEQEEISQVYPVQESGQYCDVTQATDSSETSIEINEESNVSDYSVYGWYQVANVNLLTQRSWIFFFRLTINEQGSLNDLSTAGDRTLAAWWSSDNRLHFTGYTNGNNNYYDYLEAIPVQDLVEGPFFTYYGYSSSEQSVFIYLRTSNGNVYSNLKGGYAQNPTSYLGFYLGVDFNNTTTYANLDGNFWNWFVGTGPESWVGSEGDMDAFIAGIDAPEPVEEEQISQVYPVQESGQYWDVTQTTDASETSIQISEEYDVSDYSVYGWYQVANANLLTQRSWIFFFRLTINEEGNLNDLSIAGDRTLAAWWSSDNRLHFTGYTNGNNNYYDYLEAIPVQDLVEGPFFTYYGYSSSEQSVFIYLRTSNGNVYSNLKSGYAQNPTSYLGFYLGVDFNNTTTYANLDGDFWNWFVGTGPQSWVGSEEDMDAFIAGIDAPEPEVEEVVSYEYPVQESGQYWDVTQTTDASETSIQISEDYEVSDYSVYGWYQVADTNLLTQRSWIFFFRLTINEEGNLNDLSIAGDRTLAAWWSSDNRLHFTGYTNGNNNYYDYLEAIPVEDLVEGPFFTYYGYSSSEQSVFIYLRTSNGNVYSNLKGGYAQNPTSYLGFYLGVDFNNTTTYANLDGNFWNWFVATGPGSWVGNEGDMGAFIAGIDAPEPAEPEVEEVVSQVYPVQESGQYWDVTQTTDASETSIEINEETNVSDYSVYGWYQVADTNLLTQRSWIFFFRLTINEEGNLNDLSIAGDRTLAAWWSSDNRLHFTGYTNGNNNYYDYLEAIPVQDLVEGPFFTYYGYSSSEQSVFIYLRTSNGNVYSNLKGGYAQNPTQYLGFYLGVDFNNTTTYANLDGNFWNWFVATGPGSWVGSEGDMDAFIAGIDAPEPVEAEVEEVSDLGGDYPVKTPGSSWDVTQATDSSETSLEINESSPVSDYSVYGWYQVADSNLLTQRSWIFFFRLTINEEGNLNDLSIAGDRTLAAWWSSDNRLHFTGYTTGNNNFYDYLEAIPVQDLVEGPFFTYYGYSSAEQSVFIYLRTSNGNVYSNLKGGYAQNPTQYLGFYLGVDFNNTTTYANLDGNFQNWYVSTGPSSWVGSEEDMDDFISGINTGSQEQQQGESEQQGEQELECAVVYSECNYQGESAEICDEHAQIPFESKSGRIPQGCTLTLWEESHFNGQSADFSSDFDCVENIDYQLLQKSAQESKNLRKSKQQFMGGLFKN